MPMQDPIGHVFQDAVAGVHSLFEKPSEQPETAFYPQSSKDFSASEETKACAVHTLLIFGISPKLANSQIVSFTFLLHVLHA